jgi:L-asparaginase/beta-aspartyl-peptidase (threonine type)
VVLAHGGAGSDARESSRILPAARRGLDVLGAGRGALEAAVAAAVVLEDDPRFNAGTGSTVRLDGETVQMDAAVMDQSRGFGAVAAIERVKNPVLVARAVLDSPHLLLAGDGATRFARALGMPDYDPATPESRARHRRRLERIPQRGMEGAWGRSDWTRAWNYLVPPPRELRGCDTIGVVVRDADSRFACAASSGGFGPMLRGRVGDVPIPGAGLYAGPSGAICATGEGEEIIRALVCLRVYEWLEAGLSAVDAIERGLRLVPETADLGILVVARSDAAAGARTQMGWAGIVDGRAVTPPVDPSPR